MGAGSSHARIYALLFAALDDAPTDHIIWMPAHQVDWSRQARAKGDGSPLTQLDIDTNDMADRRAKRGVEEHRVPFKIRQEWQRCMDVTRTRAKWIGRVTHEANNLPAYPFSDSESSRRAAEEAKKQRARGMADGTLLAKVRAKKGIAVSRPPALGRHSLEVHGRGGKRAWRCLSCRQVSASWDSFAPARCPVRRRPGWRRRLLRRRIRR